MANVAFGSEADLKPDSNVLAAIEGKAEVDSDDLWKF